MRRSTCDHWMHWMHWMRVQLQMGACAFNPSERVQLQMGGIFPAAGRWKGVRSVSSQWVHTSPRGICYLPFLSFDRLSFFFLLPRKPLLLLSLSPTLLACTSLCRLSSFSASSSSSSSTTTTTAKTTLSLLLAVLSSPPIPPCLHLRSYHASTRPARRSVRAPTPLSKVLYRKRDEPMPRSQDVPLYLAFTINL